MEAPKYSADGKPLNAAARKALNTAIKHSAIATQNTLNARKQSGKTRVSSMATKGGPSLLSGAGGAFIENLK